MELISFGSIRKQIKVMKKVVKDQAVQLKENENRILKLTEKYGD